MQPVKPCLGIVLMRHYSALFLHEINTLVTFIKPFILVMLIGLVMLGLARLAILKEG